MNKIKLLPIFLFLFLSVKAQDRIVSMNHDTIHCTIISINSERIVYELKNKDGSSFGKSIKLSQVEEYNRYSQPVFNTKLRKVKPQKIANARENLWCLGLGIGGSTMPWYFDNVETDGMPDTYRKLKKGYHVNANAYYQVNNLLGVGVEYSINSTSFRGNVPTQSSMSTYILVSEKSHQYIHYLGPSLQFRQHPDVRQKFTIRESISVGVMSFRLEDQNTYPNFDYSGYKEITSNTLLTGNTLSAKLGLTAEYRLDRKLSVGLGGDFIRGVLKKASFESKGSNNYNYSVQDQKLPQAMNLSRIDYSFVLRYQF